MKTTAIAFKGPGSASAFLLLLGVTVFGQSNELFDYYVRTTSRNSEISHLDNFAAHLLMDQDLVGYIAYYIGPDMSEVSAKKRILEAKEYLVKKRGISAKRIIVAKAGTMGQTMFVLQPVQKDAPPLKWFTIRSP